MTWESAVEMAYLVSGVLLPVFYAPQIVKLWRDTTRLGSYSLSKATAQLALRVPVLVFAVVIVNHSFMTFVVLADMLGRMLELAVALRALRHQGVPVHEVAARMSPTHALSSAMAEASPEPTDAAQAPVEAPAEPQEAST